MTRSLTIGAAQVGPIQLADTRTMVVERLIAGSRRRARDWRREPAPAADPARCPDAAPGGRIRGRLGLGPGSRARRDVVADAG